MNITRNNYEEYFLLYADNELSKTERKVVEIFVQENPDLKEEFSMWKLSVNSPDADVKLSDKSFLLRGEPSFINENNYEEIFVRYFDNELSGEQRKETENFIAENSKFKTDFELIGKAKLIPEYSVVYPDKKQLYRKEKSGKIIPMSLWKYVAAAISIGIGLWITAPYFSKKEVNEPVVKTTINNNVQKPAIKEEKPVTNSFSQGAGREENNIASSTKPSVQEKIKKDETEIEALVSKEQKIKEQSTANNDIKTNNKTAEQKVNTLKPDVDNHIAISDKPIKKLPGIIENIETPVEDNHIANQANKIDNNIQNLPQVQTVSYVSNTDANNQNYVFYDVPAEEFRKSKVGGFLKKVTRIVQRNNPINRLFGSEEEQVAAK